MHRTNTAITSFKSSEMEDHVRAALAFLQPDETASQFLTRSLVEQIRTGVPLIDLRAPLRATNVVEICGLASTGKTEILYGVRTSLYIYWIISVSTVIFLMNWLF